MTVASPQSSRCGPSSQRSPGRLTGTSGASGTSSPPSPSPSSPASNASSWSSSASEKPTSDRSKSSAASSCSSPASSASSHGDSASRLSARPVGAALRLGQMSEHDHRRFRSARAAWRPGPGRGPRSVRRPRPRGRERSSRTRPCWRRSWRPDPLRASSRSSHRAAARRAATSRCGPERRRGSCRFNLGESGIWADEHRLRACGTRGLAQTPRTGRSGVGFAGRGASDSSGRMAGRAQTDKIQRATANEPRPRPSKKCCSYRTRARLVSATVRPWTRT